MTTSSAPPWIASITDPAIRTDVSAVTAAGALTYAGALQILNDVEQRLASSATGLSSTAFNDLQLIAANLNNGLSTSEAVVSLFTQAVDSSPANATWNGGSASATPLGNLQAGSSAFQVRELISKWFLGGDLPDPTATTTDSNNRTQTIHPTYKAINEPLFGANGQPAVNDVQQGEVGDCELLAGTIEVLLNHPEDITSMFVAEGNGVYGVRFYLGGKPFWVTVNDQLPVYQGSLIFNGGTVLWADLLEKAYAQISATGLTGQSVVNSYNNISADAPYTVLTSLTDCTAVQYYVSANRNWNGYKSLVIGALAQGDDVIVESNGDTKDASGNQVLIADHAFAVVGYDSATGDFILRNPWGAYSSSQGYVTQFEASMADIAGVQGDFVIDNAGNPNIIVTSLGQLSSIGTNNSFGQFVPDGQYVGAGSAIPLTSLFSLVDLAGKSVNDYMVQAIGLGSVQLNGAANLATATQKAAGQYVVSAADIGKLSFAAGNVTGATDLLLSASDGVAWSTPVDVSLTITNHAIFAAPLSNSLVAPGSKLALAPLFSVFGADPSSLVYDLVVENGRGSIALNGATDLLGGHSRGQVAVSGAELADLSYTAPSSAPAATLGLVYIDLTLEKNGVNVSDQVQIPILVGHSVSESLSLYQQGKISSWIGVTDQAANIFANIDALQQMVSVGDIAGIALTDSGKVSESISASQASQDLGALSLLGPQVSLTVTDRATNVVAALDSLQRLANDGELANVTLTDGGVPSLTISIEQYNADTKALGQIGGYFDVVVAMDATDPTVIGLAGHGVTALFANPAAQYRVEAAGDGVHFSVSANGVTDQFSAITTLQFSDVSDFVASLTPAAGATVSSEQVTSLYAAVLDRKPDVTGLAFYENIADSNPGLTIVTYAEWFMTSPEYVAAHNYALNASGDAQFISDTYANLLHRAPSAVETSYYQSNVITPIVSYLTAHGASLAAAELGAHASLLADFSQSSEFLGDVQVTATNPSSASHWLILI